MPPTCLRSSTSKHRGLPKHRQTMEESCHTSHLESATGARFFCATNSFNLQEQAYVFRRVHNVAAHGLASPSRKATSFRSEVPVAHRAGRCEAPRLASGGGEQPRRYRPSHKRALPRPKQCDELSLHLHGHTNMRD